MFLLCSRLEHIWLMWQYMAEAERTSPMSSSPVNSSQDDNSYFIDHESAAEMARLLDQDRLYTEAMGGFFSERSDLSMIQRILDIGCGPGGWVQEVAYAYPEKEVVG